MKPMTGVKVDSTVLPLYGAYRVATSHNKFGTGSGSGLSLCPDKSPVEIMARDMYNPPIPLNFPRSHSRLFTPGQLCL